MQILLQILLQILQSRWNNVETNAVIAPVDSQPTQPETSENESSTEIHPEEIVGSF